MVVTTYDARLATDEAYQLAEGPVWDPERGRVLWVDIRSGRVMEGTLAADRIAVVTEHRFAGTVGAVVPARDGGLLVAGSKGLATIAADGSVRTGPSVVPDAVDSRLNDGACDPAGRFLVGSMALDGRVGQERLYRLDGDGSVRVVDQGFTLSNGLGWSPDGRTLYHVDSIPGTVWSRPYDPASATVGPRREHLRVDGGLPDGLCVDVDGNLWIAIWDAGEVRCYSPAAEHLATVGVPAPHTSSAAFVGPGRDRLLITTARDELSDADLAAFPASGRLFLADVGTAGVPTTAWSGGDR